MRVLVTRATDDAARTGEHLRKLGHEAIVAPVIEIIATGNALPNEPVDAIVATSVHALTGIDHLPSALMGAPWLVVGGRLRDALVARDFGEPEIVSTDVSNLIVEIGERYPEPFRFLYPAGRDRKDTLERVLRDAGHELTVVETYEARETQAFDAFVVNMLRDGTIAAVLHFSRRSADLFVTRIRDAGLSHIAGNMRHIAISTDAATPIEARGWSVEIAQRPDEESMLALLA